MIPLDPQPIPAPIRPIRAPSLAAVFAARLVGYLVAWALVLGLAVAACNAIMGPAGLPSSTPQPIATAAPTRATVAPTRTAKPHRTARPTLAPVLADPTADPQPDCGDADPADPEIDPEWDCVPQ